MNPISSILRSVTRDKSERLNLLVFSAHERYEPSLARINANFYALPGKDVRIWNTKYAPIPSNYFITNGNVPSHIVFDAIICHNPYIHIPLALPIAHQLNIPIINIFHTDSPGGNYDYEQSRQLFERCFHHVFISEYNRLSWGFGRRKDTTVIYHGIDSDLFNPGNLVRNNIITTIANDFIGRNNELGYSIWKEVTRGLPTNVIGSTVGLSEPAKSVEDLVEQLQKSKIYLNTTLRSPTPMSLLESMAMGCAVVTTNTNAIPDFCRHNKNCLMFSPQMPQDGRKHLERLLNDDELAKKLGQSARETILEKFSMARFIKEWENLLEIETKKVVFPK